jgi:hypothetical protein
MEALRNPTRDPEAHVGRAKTSARWVAAPFRFASRWAGFEPFVRIRLHNQEYLVFINAGR